ncbi:MAG: hypothetical protein M3370_11585 [Actinomycetota bacterium]|nr:hypothetical protein [Actinomycetota bacterium]
MTSTRDFVRGHRRSRAAPSASVVKALLLVAALREVSDEPLPADLEALLDPMIRTSDNAADHGQSLAGLRAGDRGGCGSPHARARAA